jgi:hypothetical protein
VDGTPLDEAVLIQKLQSSEALKRDYSEPMRHRIGEKNWLITCSLDPNNLASCFVPDPDLDPFAENSNETIRESLKLEEVKVPDILKVWFPQPVFDLKKQIGAAGIIMKDADFAGYSPYSQRIFFFAGDSSELDKFETLFTPMCIRSPKQIATSLEGSGESRLVTRSGTKSAMTRIVNNGLMRSIKIEPTIDETGELVDLRLEYLDQPDSAHKQSITSCLTLRSGKTVEIMSAAANDSNAKPLRVKAEIMEVPR